MNNYVMMFRTTDIIAGGPIYNCNKKKYLEQNGWVVNVIPTWGGHVLLEPLREYEGISFPYVTSPPFIFSEKELHEKLELLASYVSGGDKIVIETGTDYTALWGELLAEYIGAKHFIMFLDETNKNVNKISAPFYKFKYGRGELASISLYSLKAIFSQFFDLEEAESHVLSAACTNIVADIENPFEVKIPKGDFLIGSIGRLDKGFVPNIINGICEFARSVPNKKVAVCLIGGADSKTEMNIRTKLEKERNIFYYITGYIWPIPKRLFENFDLFISGAGSARVSANMGIPTIRMDVITYEPLGFLENLEPQNWKSKCIAGATVKDYIYRAVLKGEVPQIKGRVPIEMEWKAICNHFDGHMEFLENSVPKKKYYATNLIRVGGIRARIEKILLKCMQYEQLYQIEEKIKDFVR